MTDNATNSQLTLQEQNAMLRNALEASRAWIVERRPALTLSRQSTIDAYMGVLNTIDAASAQHGGF